MTLPEILFYFFALVAAASALGVLFTRNVFYGALQLLTCLLALAGIYVLAFAEFVSVTQILVYAGGILVVIIFGIMLTAKITGQVVLVENGKWFSGILVGALLFTTLLYLFSSSAFSTPGVPLSMPEHTMMNTIGYYLMTDYIVPFEIAGILLLMALVGAAVTATFKRKNA